jgi:hypothetical protein
MMRRWSSVPLLSERKTLRVCDHEDDQHIYLMIYISALTQDYMGVCVDLKCC